MLVFTGVYSVICCVIWYSLPQRATLFLFTYAIIYWFALDTETPVIKELYDTFEVDRGNTLKIFETVGFKIVNELTWKKFGKEVTGVEVKIEL